MGRWPQLSASFIHTKEVMIIQTEKEVQKIRKHGNTQMIYVGTANLASARIKSIIYLQNKNNDDDIMMTPIMVMLMRKESYKAIIIDHF